MEDLPLVRLRLNEAGLLERHNDLGFGLLVAHVAREDRHAAVGCKLPGDPLEEGLPPFGREVMAMKHIVQQNEIGSAAAFAQESP